MRFIIIILAGLPLDVGEGGFFFDLLSGALLNCERTSRVGEKGSAERDLGERCVSFYLSQDSIWLRLSNLAGGVAIEKKTVNVFRIG